VYLINVILKVTIIYTLAFYFNYLIKMTPAISSAEYKQNLPSYEAGAG